MNSVKTQPKQPESLRLADALAYCDASVARQAADELRSQHHRILELEQGKCLYQIAEPAAATSAATTATGITLPWPLTEVLDLLERLVSSHISAFIAGERGSNKPEVRAFVKSALVDAAGFIRAALDATQPAAQGLNADSFAQTMSDWAHGDAEDAARWRHTLAHRLTLSPRHLRTDEEVCADIDADLAAQAKDGSAA